ncbi:MAG: NADP oxidoreductase [Deltaproteobacteria bacterium]|nr:NADP oxidoreductase [Deltaproteobacteria bacterium]
MGKIRMATTWLDGCSGCHMSLLDMDEQLIDILGKVDIVYGPLVDAKVIPEGIDVVLVEGAVSTDADVEKLRLLRERSAILVSLGDCAVTANVPGMRNRFPLAEVLKRGYEENAPLNAQIPREDLPHLLDKTRPLHEFVPVDVFLPGCPPPADAIVFMLQELLAGRIPDLSDKSRFGA